MNWQTLKYFEAVAKTEHYTRAANELHITQSALSKSIRNLEEDIGVPLFEPNGRNVRLTKYGHILYAHVASATAEIEEAVEHIQSISGIHGGEVTFAAIFSLGAFWLPRIIKDFKNQYPDIRLRLYQKSTADILADVMAGKADLGFVGEFPRDDKYACIDMEPISEEEILLAVPEDHPLARRTDPIPFRELTDENFIGWTGNTGIIYSIRKALEREGLGDFQFREDYQGAEENSVASMVREGLGIALIADTPLVHREGLSFLHLRDPYLYRTLYLVWKKDSYLSPAIKAFKYYVLQQSVLNVSDPNP